MSTSTMTLDALFTPPRRPPTILAPSLAPGHTAASQRTLVKLLKANHDFHCYYHDAGFHNHLAHHLFASYAFGAPPSLLEAIFAHESKIQRPKPTPPGMIDETNWKSHLGRRDYYAAYLTFFSARLLDRGLGPTLEEYFFSEQANRGGESDSGAPQMLNRLVSGLFHPLIHLGHGAETGILGLAAEGMAQAAVTDAQVTPLVPSDIFSHSDQPPSQVGLSHAFASMSLDMESFPTSTRGGGVDAFTVVQRILDDPTLAAGQISDESSRTKFTDAVRKRGEDIYDYCKEWTFAPDEIPHKLEELAWVSSLIYGVGGWRPDRPFRADFFNMHLTTSCVFLPSVLTYLRPESQIALLRAYFNVAICYWVSRGRQSFPIEHFFASTDPNPIPPSTLPHPNEHLLDKTNLVQNPWLNLTESCLAHPSEHLIKLQRSLAHFGALYGGRPKGYFTDHLRGAELLDGTLFIRIAGLSAKRMGWVREGEEEGEWDRMGFWNW